MRDTQHSLLCIPKPATPFLPPSGSAAIHMPATTSPRMPCEDLENSAQKSQKMILSQIKGILVIACYSQEDGHHLFTSRLPHILACWVLEERSATSYGTNQPLLPQQQAGRFGRGEHKGLVEGHCWGDQAEGRKISGSMTQAPLPLPGCTCQTYSHHAPREG